MNLIKYDAACKAIAEAKSLDEVKDIADKALALKEYARQAKNKQGEIDFAEVRMRAERKWGQMYSEAEKHEGGRPITGNTVRPVIETPTLKDMGVDKRFSSKAQKIGTIPDGKYEELVGEWRDRVQLENERVTTRLIRESDKVEPKEAPPLPEGKYNVLVIAPPWPMEKIERDARPNQIGFDYPTMTEDELARLDLPFGDDSHIFLWTTHKFLPMALRLFICWDVKYILTMVWHKPGGFQPFNLPQYNCEFVLYGRIGTPKFADTKAFNVCFNAARGKHSEKPEEFYELLRRVTDGKRIDIFNRRPIDGFDAWGNEA